MTATLAGFELESSEYDLASETYRFGYDRDTTSASMAVVAALSEVTGTNPTALEPLHAFVDTDALDALVGGRSTDGDAHVTFTVGERSITAYSGAVVEVAPAERSDGSNTRKVRG